MIRLCVCLLVVLCGSGVCAAPADVVLRDGEAFDYALSFRQGFVSVPAGEARLSVTATNVNGQAAFALELSLKASATVETFYRLRTRFTSVVTPSLEPLSYTKHAEEGRRVYTEATTFTRRGKVERKARLTRAIVGRPVQTGRDVRTRRIYDLVSVSFFARGLNLDVVAEGTRLPVSVASGVTVRDRELVVQGEEMVEGPDGKGIPCRVCVLLGKEKDASSETEVAKFWISKDARRMPVRIDLALKVGHVSVRLARLQ